MTYVPLTLYKKKGLTTIQMQLGVDNVLLKMLEERRHNLEVLLPKSFTEIWILKIVSSFCEFSFLKSQASSLSS